MCRGYKRMRGNVESLSVVGPLVRDDTFTATNRSNDVTRLVLWVPG